MFTLNMFIPFLITYLLGIVFKTYICLLLAFLKAHKLLSSEIIVRDVS